MRRCAVTLVLMCTSLLACREGSEPAATAAPFTVREGATGLVFAYHDGTAFQTVESIAEVPPAHRGAVRVESLALPPDARPDPTLVVVADLRRPASDGTYPTRTMPRESFEASFERTRETTPASTGEIVLYGASWCPACRQAKQYFTERGIAFVERDVEREPGAREEMMRKARAQGVTPQGIPVIDVRGRIVPGFDRATIERLLSGG